MKLTKNELQKALDALTAANRKAHKARNKIFAHCEAVYGGHSRRSEQRFVH
jgi:hypothetical protein